MQVVLAAHGGMNSDTFILCVSYYKQSTKILLNLGRGRGGGGKYDTNTPSNK